MQRHLKTGLAVVAAGTLFAVGGVSTAAAAKLITGKDIKNNSVTSVDLKNGSVTGADIRDGSVKVEDLSPAILAYIQGQAGKDGANGKDGLAGKDGANGKDGLAGKDGANGKDGAAGKDGANGKDGAPGSLAGVQSNWAPHNNAVILTDKSVRLTHEGDGSALQIEDLNKAVQAGQILSFTYKLEGGATYAAGVPRVFVELQGTYVNTFDADPSDAGVANGDGTFTKSITIPKNGRVGEAGIVKDFGVGSVIVSNLTINGQVLSFR
jgi:hypothetical protein